MFPQRIAVNSSDKEDEFLNNDHNSHDHENDDETGNNININNNLFIDYQLKRRSSRAAYSSNEKDEGGGYTVDNDKQHSTKRSLKTSLGPQGLGDTWEDIQVKADDDANAIPFILPTFGPRFLQFRSRNLFFST